jgi:hypothetical protein
MVTVQVVQHAAAGGTRVTAAAAGDGDLDRAEDRGLVGIYATGGSHRQVDLALPGDEERDLSVHVLAG